MNQDWLSTYLPCSNEQACAVRYDGPGRMRNSWHLNDALLKVDHHNRCALRIEFKVAHRRIPLMHALTRPPPLIRIAIRF